ncbi:hypothetical protein WG66_013153 [Moniliophthora roreri]|nr:hypothetical protein WG66_013153 [Moniliophthora roreri]
MMIAGRALYISRKAKGMFGVGIQKMFHLVIAITVESGMIYPVTLIMFAVFMAFITTFLHNYLQSKGQPPDFLATIVVAGNTIQNTIMNISGGWVEKT